MLMKERYLLIVLLMFNVNIAQEAENAKPVDSLFTNSSLYNHRTENSKPSYSLVKIEKLIAKSRMKNNLDEVEETPNEEIYLSEKDFNKLSVKEKFTYTMVYPEIKSSNFILDSLNFNLENKIFGMLPLTANYPKWSLRQQKFLKENRKIVQELIQETSVKNQKMGLNFKKALIEINAIESIPFIIDFYKSTDKNDKDLLTVLMLLVKKSNYYPFVRSNIYRKLYNDTISYQKSNIEYSEANEEYILKTAKNFYLQSPKIK